MKMYDHTGALIEEGKLKYSLTEDKSELWIGFDHKYCPPPAIIITREELKALALYFIEIAELYPPPEQ